jgi:hypothetical protein
MNSKYFHSFSFNTYEHNVYVCMYVCMYVCVYVYMCVCVCIYIYIYIHSLVFSLWAGFGRNQSSGTLRTRQTALLPFRRKAC